MGIIQYFCYIVLLMGMSVSTFAQIKIIKPENIPFDSIRLTESGICFGDTITSSTSALDVRIYRFVAFVDYKVIRISSIRKSSFLIDVYSFTAWNALLFHKQYSSRENDLRIKELFKQYDILNLPDLDGDSIGAKALPMVQCGSNYQVEAKVGEDFTYKSFNNPETYAQHYADRASQAVAFTGFIKGVEEITGITILRDSSGL